MSYSNYAKQNTGSVGAAVANPETSELCNLTNQIQTEISRMGSLRFDLDCVVNKLSPIPREPEKAGDDAKEMGRELAHSETLYTLYSQLNYENAQLSKIVNHLIKVIG
jgi:hypothetical protein